MNRDQREREAVLVVIGLVLAVVGFVGYMIFAIVAGG